jgi:hypothetical protein
MKAAVARSIAAAMRATRITYEEQSSHDNSNSHAKMWKIVGALTKNDTLISDYHRHEQC